MLPVDLSKTQASIKGEFPSLLRAFTLAPCRCNGGWGGVRMFFWTCCAGYVIYYVFGCVQVAAVSFQTATIPGSWNYVQWCPTFQHIFHTIQLWVYHGLSKHGVCTPKCLFKWENHDKRSNCGLRYPISRQTIHSLEFHSWRMTPSADPQLGLLQSAI